MIFLRPLRNDFDKCKHLISVSDISTTWLSGQITSRRSCGSCMTYVLAVVLFRGRGRVSGNGSRYGGHLHGGDRRSGSVPGRGARHAGGSLDSTGAATRSPGTSRLVVTTKQQSTPSSTEASTVFGINPNTCCFADGSSTRYYFGR